MSEYNPDRWVIVELKTPKETLYKVLATWYGGYLDGDSWKLSSGIRDVKRIENGYAFHNHSGSVYNCHKEGYGMNMYTASIYEGFEKLNTDEIKISLVAEEDIEKMSYFVPSST
jgi:hypothetical protein